MALAAGLVWMAFSLAAFAPAGPLALLNSFVWSADQAGEQPGATCTNAPCGGANPRVGVDNSGTRKEAMPAAVRMGALVSYTIVPSNAGSAAVTTQVTDTLAVSATLVGATPGYNQTGQTLVWSGVNVPAGGTAVLTITVRAGSGPLPGGYTLPNSVTIGAADGQITRDAPSVTVEPWRVFAPVVMRP